MWPHDQRYNLWFYKWDPFNLHQHFEVEMFSFCHMTSCAYMITETDLVSFSSTIKVTNMPRLMLIGSCASSDITFKFCQVTSYDCMIKERFILLGKWKLLNWCHHPAKFGAYASYGSGEEMFLICHVILFDHVIKGHITLWAGANTLSHHCAKFDTYRSYGSGDITLFCHVTSHNMINGTCHMVSGSCTT